MNSFNPAKKTQGGITTNNSARLASVRKQRRYSSVQLNRAKGVKRWRHDLEMAKFAELSKLEGSLKAAMQLEKRVPSMAGAMGGNETSNINPGFIAKAFGTKPGRKSGSSKTEGVTGATTTATTATATTAATTTLSNTPSSPAKLRLKSAIQKVKLTNMMRNSWLMEHEHEDSESGGAHRPAAAVHSKPWVGSCLVVLHLFGILLCYALSQMIWTYDGLDAVELVEAQILLTSSELDHTHSRYTDVDSHWAFRQYLPILMEKLFSGGGGEGDVAGHILRYSVHEDKEEVCPRYLLNSSFYLAKYPGDKIEEDRQSRSYKSFRPLSNKGPAFKGYEVSESAAYLSDGVILRQLRGDTWLGSFAPDHGAVARCGSSQVLSTDNQVFTSGVKGLYMVYPSTGGFDLFFGAETAAADVQKRLKDAFECGWVDQNTRAVMAIFTLTFFRNLERLDNARPQQ